MTIDILGRRLRLAVIGGGGEALIGPVHRMAARLDDLIEIKAAVLSRDPQTSTGEARRLGIERGYGDLGALIEAEAERDDGIDAVAIMTPNDSHVPLALQAIEAGLDVIVDKPLANDPDEARELSAAVRRSGLICALTHNYSGYPMIRQARAMIREGCIGRLQFAAVHYAQGTLAERIETGDIPSRLRWRLDPAQGGPSHVMGDIGTHAHQLLTFISGKQVRAVMAEIGALVPSREAHDTAQALLHLDDGLHANFWVTKVANGAENELEIEIYGDKGGLRWCQSDCGTLEWVSNGEPAQRLTRGNRYLAETARNSTRIPPGHPEAFIEAFANIYADFARCVASRLAGHPSHPLWRDFPDAEDGVTGLEFIDAAVRSSQTGQWVSLSTS